MIAATSRLTSFSKIVGISLLAPSMALAAGGVRPEVNSVYPSAYALYINLHQHPELSGQEVRTAAILAERLRRLGYSVTEHVGGTGIVAILRNGPGKTVMLRTELDALPVKEETGLAYASTVHARDPAGQDVPVGHMCGHDLHMSALVATAELMAHSKSAWRGTLMLIGQPAEETLSGAAAMVRDGLFTRFPRPDVVLALHVGNSLPAGEVGIRAGPVYTNADSLRITIYGRGGHGAAPETTVDPIVIAARTIVALQTIVSREVKPGDVAVVTVGYVHAGTKNNIIPEQAELGLTVRTYNPQVRKHVLEAIRRITEAEAQAAGVPRAPSIERYEGTDAVVNDAALVRQLRPALEASLGKANVLAGQPAMASEDFSAFVQQGIPGFYLGLGGADPAKYAAAQASGISLPSNHSPLFAPDVDPALHTAITAEVTMLRSLLGAGST